MILIDTSAWIEYGDSDFDVLARHTELRLHEYRR